MVAVSSKQPQSNETSTQSLVDRVDILEKRERMTVERVVLRVEMCIRDLHNRRTVDHKEFMSKDEGFIKEVKELKNNLQQTLRT